MPTIFLDTNVFIDAGYFRAAGAQAFLRTCKFAGFDIAVPEVVLDEVRGNFEKDLSSAIVSLTKAERQVARFVAHGSDGISLEDEMETFDKNLEELLLDVGVDVLPYPNTTTKELVLGGYSNRKPFKEGGEGHKDFLIWKSIVEVIVPADEPHLLVTSNTSDFAQEKSKDTFNVHTELLSDVPDGVLILGFTGRKSLLDKHVLPRLDGWKPWSDSKVDLDIESFTDRVIGKELPWRTMYGLEGLPFSNEVTLLMYGNPEGLVVHYALIEDQYMVRIRGNSECLFDGYMEKWEYFSEYSDTMSGSDWNDHVVNVEAEAIVEFEIMATYNAVDGELGGATLKVLNEIEDDLYQ
ncbi:PIN domain-containing protein [uncultured Sulfitobacter sp.]|uniref:PIN domain-containing protein n=1 Tax=uncultured Sulfitobacter sp. TaxID=191468 RepID=UPI0030DC6819